MRENVALALWSNELGGNLDQLERSAIEALQPPLNLDKWPNPERARIRRERASMTAIVRGSAV